MATRFIDTIILMSTLKFRFKLSVNFADNVVYPRKGLRLNVF